jgi:hypothetical protein
MKDLEKFTSTISNQTYRVMAEIDDFGPTKVVAWRCGARPIEFVFEVDGFADPLLNEINSYVLGRVYSNPGRMPKPEDFVDVLVEPI